MPWGQNCTWGSPARLAPPRGSNRCHVLSTALPCHLAPPHSTPGNGWPSLDLGALLGGQAKEAGTAQPGEEMAQRDLIHVSKCFCKGLEGQDKENGFPLPEGETGIFMGYLEKFFPVRAVRPWHRQGHLPLHQAAPDPIQPGLLALNASRDGEATARHFWGHKSTSANSIPYSTTACTQSWSEGTQTFSDALLGAGLLFCKGPFPADRTVGMGGEAFPRGACAER